MRIRKALKEMLAGLLLLVGGAGLVGLSGLTAAVAEDGVTRLIRSEYQSPIPGREKSTIWWLFASSTTASGGTRVLVTDRDLRAQTRAELYYDQQNVLLQVDCYRQRRGQEICEARIYDSSAPVIMSQSLIPGDWLNRQLPFVPREKVGEYLVKEQVGVTVFSSRLQITEKEIELDEACNLAMINSDNQALVQERRLRLVTVNKVMGAGEEKLLLMRQLWAVGDSYWLYEEKGGRRSWRCAQQ